MPRWTRPQRAHGMGDQRKHPHFDDKGTLDWHTSWDEARAAARAGGKRLFVEYGRVLCGSCRSLVQALVPRPDIAPLLAEHFVAVAADVDDTEPALHQLVYELPNAQMLPFVIVTDADGRFLDGHAGPLTPDELRRLLEGVLAR